ncbi:hypothetical protein SAMN05421749_103145 [Acinetobacter marinus]|uniref:Uncharacterized protein n=1 Tax=Acinetobacter marinus TaxID=281375 RepID=A0A1G6IU34_9GAMM|nr:hypothetical protein [Acinetobacter marinus]SDC09943.1 hypothetical protein SAMN05421749_103145 [Acinetobacter marinus]
MNFKIIFILLCLVALGVYGYPKYKLIQQEKQIHKSNIAIPSGSAVQRLMPFLDHQSKAEFYNQYPIFSIDIRLVDYEQTDAPEGSSAFLKKFSCGTLNGLKTNTALYRNAALNVNEKDAVEFQYFIKNNLGQTILQVSQKMDQCDNIDELRAIKDSKFEPKTLEEVQANQPQPNAQGLAEAEARNRQEERGF